MWTKAIQFELQELLGEGGQGSVYKALRRDSASRLEHTVAVKILHSKTAVDLWRREFESLSRVCSKYCARVLSFERIGRRPALVLEYIDGVSLARLAAACALGAEDVHEIAAQLEHGLRDLHGHGVFHGDLSPQNILIDLDGGIHLLDFGLANCAPGPLRLTPDFSAPERLAGAEVSAATDFYSLGRVLEFAGGLQEPAPEYCARDPAARRLRGLHCDPQAQRRLGARVREYRRRMALMASAQTLTQSHSPPAPRPVRVAAMGVITSFLLLTASGASQAHLANRAGVLSVRTQRWYYFLLDGKPVGYPPFSLPLEGGRTYRLDWISAHSRGARPVVLNERETRVLEDSDFSH